MDLSQARRGSALHRWRISIALFAAGSGAFGYAQTAPAGPADRPPASSSQAHVPERQAGPESTQLFNFRESDIKFRLESLMRTLRDGGHEGWILATYPDPKTARPLIGAGFSLDLEARDHPQRDPLNPHAFLEPSSAQLWQAAGLDPDKLQHILERYNSNLSAWKAKRFRQKLKAHTLVPEVTDEEATRLLRISAIQAIYNARGYCRSFDQLSASQQLGLSQLVFQMGVNLEEFVDFLALLNANPATNPAASPTTAEQVQNVSLPIHPERESPDSAHWNAVQDALIASQWARRYSRRASTVIAMFDPRYAEDPLGAQTRVEATLHPAAARRRRGDHAASKQVATQIRRKQASPRPQAQRQVHPVGTKTQRKQG